MILVKKVRKRVFTHYMCLNEGSSLHVQDFCFSGKVKLLFSKFPFCSGIL